MSAGKTASVEYIKKIMLNYDKDDEDNTRKTEKKESR